MSRKSLSKKASLNKIPSLDEERLDFEKIAEIDPWKSMEKYDKQEAGQIQEILGHFNDMVLNDKKNKRKSVGKSRASASSTKVTNSNEEESAKKEKQRNYGNTNANENAEEKSVEEEKEDDKLEEIKEKPSKAINRDVIMPKDKQNKRKSASKSRASTSSTKTDISNEVLKEKSAKNERKGNDEIQEGISELSVNDSSIDILKNVTTKNTSDNKNTEEINVEEEKTERLEEKKEKSSKPINRVKRRSAGETRASVSSMKPIASNKTAEGHFAMKQNKNNDKFQYRLPTSDKASLTFVVEKNINADYKSDNKSTKSFEEEKKDEDKLEKITEKTISEEVTEISVGFVDDTLASGNRQEIRRSVSPLTIKELPIDETSDSDCFMQHETILAGHVANTNSEILCSTTLDAKPELETENRKNSVLRRAATNSPKKPSTMKARSASADPMKERVVECNNNKYESKHARKEDEKMAKAFDKFGKQFVKYSNRIEYSQNYKTGPADVSIDSESDSDSSDDSSSRSSDCDASPSASYSTSSSRCSCCCTSSSADSSSYSSCSDSSFTSSSTSCSCCGGYDVYSEYTLTSSSSTHSDSDESDDSTDSSET